MGKIKAESRFFEPSEGDGESGTPIRRGPTPATFKPVTLPRTPEPPTEVLEALGERPTKLARRTEANSVA